MHDHGVGRIDDSGHYRRYSRNCSSDLSDTALQGIEIRNHNMKAISSKTLRFIILGGIENGKIKAC